MTPPSAKPSIGAFRNVPKGKASCWCCYEQFLVEQGELTWGYAGYVQGIQRAVFWLDGEVVHYCISEVSEEKMVHVRSSLREMVKGTAISAPHESIGVRMTDMAAIHEAIDVLNRIHAADPSVLSSLISQRVPCNEALADDPTVQMVVKDDGTFEVGLLGIINGVFGVDARNVGYIAAIREDDGTISRFEWNGHE